MPAGKALFLLRPIAPRIVSSRADEMLNRVFGMFYHLLISVQIPWYIFPICLEVGRLVPMLIDIMVGRGEEELMTSSFTLINC